MKIYLKKSRFLMRKYDTTISGAAITSTFNLMSMIGDIGKEILKKFGVKKINLNEECSFL